MTQDTSTHVVLNPATGSPVTEVELASVKGLGPVKVDRYGGDLLALLAAS